MGSLTLPYTHDTTTKIILMFLTWFILSTLNHDIRQKILEQMWNV